jgi:tripartite-type tricarboxylate transporter receptor subunit TctC
MTDRFHSRRSLLAASALAALAPASAFAQAAFPSRPIRFICPVGPGTNSDNLTRWVSERVAKVFNVPTLVENRPGGDMLIAVQAMMQQPADGHTILMLSPTAVIINPLILKNLPYDADRDIRSVAGPMRSIAAIVVSGTSKYKHFTDLVDDARARPGIVSMAWYAQSYRIAIAGFERDAKVRFNSVPYKTPSQITTDLIGGNLDATITDFGGALAQAKAGKIRILAVTASQRDPRLPDVPTVAESGFPNYTLYQLTGFGVNGKTPDDVAKKIEAAILDVTSTAEFKAFIENAGAEPAALTGAQLHEAIVKERERYREILKSIPA